MENHDFELTDSGVANAEFEQSKSEAMDELRNCKSFFLVAMNWDEEKHSCVEAISLNFPVILTEDVDGDFLFAVFTTRLLEAVEKLFYPNGRESQ